MSINQAIYVEMRGVKRFVPRRFLPNQAAFAFPSVFTRVVPSPVKEADALQERIIQSPFSAFFRGCRL